MKSEKNKSKSKTRRKFVTYSTPGHLTRMYQTAAHFLLFVISIICYLLCNVNFKPDPEEHATGTHD